ncbi:hypothetical protein [Fenollaria sporofastidiosus]|nr:hypothetical protein [Fenollaria sporofastidiosus]
MKKIRKIFSMVLALMMLVGLMPTNIAAGGVHLSQVQSLEVL